MDVLKQDLRRDPNDVWNKYRGIFAGDKGIAWPMEKTLNYQRGIKLEDLRTHLSSMDASPGFGS